MATLELLVESGLIQYYILTYPPMTQQRKNGHKSSWETLLSLDHYSGFKGQSYTHLPYLSFEITFPESMFMHACSKNQWLVSHSY